MIGIIGAMPEEVHELVSIMETVQEEEKHGLKMWKGRLASKDVVLVLSGVGKVNASYTASTLIATHDIEGIINIGSAGGLQTHQKIGDVVCASVLQYHDLDIGPDTYKDPRFIFHSDPNYLKIAEKTLDALEIAHHIGLIVTGDQFITKHQSQFKVIQENFADAICVEMEAAAIAAACTRSKTPFIVLRGLSDIPLEDGNEVAFEVYLQKAAQNSAKICKQFVQYL